jgi:uncharacterized damage-inducible protein DinB
MKAIEILAKQLATTTKLVKNVLADIDDTSGKHPTEPIARLRWLAGHLLVTRSRFALRFGIITEPFPYLDSYIIKDNPPPNARPLDLSIAYPQLETLRQLWSQYSEGLPEALTGMTDEQLAGDGPFASPLGTTLLDNIAFVVIHESYHIGQMGTLRKSLGYESMSFR